MKKNIFTLFFLSIFIVAACDSSPSMPEAMDKMLQEDMFNEPIVQDLEFPEYYEGYQVEFHSTDQRIIHNDGSVNTRAYPDGERTVDIEITMSDGNDVYQRTVTFTVGVDPETAHLYEALEDLENRALFNDVFDEDVVLVDSVDDLDISYEIDSPYLNENGEVTRPPYHTGGVDVDVNVTVSDGENELSKIFTVALLQKPYSTISYDETLEFENLATEYLLDDTTLDVFYTMEGGLPYVDIESFLTLLDGGEQTGAIDKSQLEITHDGPSLTISITIEADDEEYEEGDTPVEEDTTFILDFAFDENRITVNEFNFFGSFSESTQTDFGSGLSVSDYEEHPGDDVTFELSEYDLEIIHDEERGYLMPFQMANLFFSGQMFDVSYNGDELIGWDTYQRQSATVQNRLRDSSLNNEPMSDAILLKTYNYMVFTFDYFYGLKDDQGVDTYYDVFSKEQITAQGNNHYDAVFRSAYNLDDLHTSYLMSGFYRPDHEVELQLSHLGSRTRGFYQNFWDIEDMNLCERDEVIYYDNGRVALIPVAGFDEDTGDDFDAFMQEIQLQAGVEDIVVDLSCNTGGIVGGMIQVIGHMTNEPIPFHYLNPTDGATATYWYESEVDAYDEYNWHVLSSPITYSAGNMMVRTVQEMGIAHVIGEDSAGGAASIRTNILPTGAIIIMSSTSVSADEDYNSVEMGIPVDTPLSLEDFTDESAILEAISQE